MSPSTERVTIGRSAWLRAAWSMTRWHSSGQSCISPSMAFPPGSWLCAIGYRRAPAAQPENRSVAAPQRWKVTQAASIWMRWRPILREGGVATGSRLARSAPLLREERGGGERTEIAAQVSIRATNLPPDLGLERRQVRLAAEGHDRHLAGARIGDDHLRRAVALEQRDIARLGA